MRALAVAILTFSLPSAAQPLPEGDSGIAAQYPDDIGITDAPEVVFADDFEDASGELEVGQWDNVYGSVDIVGDEVHAGARAVRISHVQPQSHGAWRDFGQDGFDTLHVRYYMRYHPEFPGVHHSGVAIHAGAPGWDIGAGTGVVPDGTTHFTALLDNIAPFFSWSPAGNAPPGFAYIYCYHMDQGSQWGDVFLPDGEVMPGSPDLFGPEFVPRPNVIPERGTWIAFELMVRANTPGMQDGRIAFWIDGVLAADFPNLRLRSDDALEPNYVVMASYSSEVFPNQTLWYDDLVVATSYIGPMASATSAASSSSSSSASAGVGGSGAGPSSSAAGGVADVAPESDGGCSCRHAPAPRTPWLLCAAALALSVRRRRCVMRTPKRHEARAHRCGSA